VPFVELTQPGHQGAATRRAKTGAGPSPGYFANEAGVTLFGDRREKLVLFNAEIEKFLSPFRLTAFQSGRVSNAIPSSFSSMRQAVTKAAVADGNWGWLFENAVLKKRIAPSAGGFLYVKKSISQAPGTNSRMSSLSFSVASQAVLQPVRSSARRLNSSVTCRLVSGRKRLENALALKHPLTTAQLQELEALFPPPKGPSPLEMI
jgi:hypothetical protein